MTEETKVSGEVKVTGEARVTGYSAAALAPPAGRRPVVVVFRPGTAAALAQALAAAGLDCDIVAWRPGEPPPPV